MVSRSRSSSITSDGSGSPARSRASSFSSVNSDDRSPLHDAAYRNDVKRLRRLLSQGADPWLHAGYYDEGTEADEAKYDSLVADITRKVAEMACLKGPRASVTAARLSAAFESDSEEDYYSD